ncbi:aspartate racemase/maleate isomerase family protein [Lentisalinibacter orientalis]|uniref:aspartate racemase/maleate isomerase family protein n=1 Tax=Lentisalinibacter orientalis TaxID=2992241 RepID=UPI00386A677E
MVSLGLLSPNLIPARLVDARSILPADISLAGYGFSVPRYTSEEFERVLRRLIQEEGVAVDDDLDMLMVTGELFLAHADKTDRSAILKRLSDRVACRVATILDALGAAFKTVGASHLLVAAPFTADQTTRLSDHLDEFGLTVIGATSLGLTNSTACWELPAEESYRFILDSVRAHPGVACLYLPNNQWRVTPLIQKLEDELAITIVANTPAWIRYCLRELGDSRTIPSFGRLLATP